MNRIDRLSAIIIQLQSRRTVRAKDIADRYRISLRTVYRDISALEEAGIPIIGEAGIGYSLQEGYRLPAVMFTREEATALITAEKLVTQLTDENNGSLFSNALDKIRSVLETGEKDYLHRVEGKIEVLNPIIPQNLTQDNILQVILASLGAHLVMKLHYAAPYKQDHTKRTIEPVGVFYVNRFWHLIAFCRERNDYRDFRFDRIKQLSTTSVKFKTKHPVLKHFLNQEYKNIKLEEVTLLVDHNGAVQIGDSKYYYGYISERSTATGIEMEFMTMSIDGFARWYISISDHATILHSAVLKTTVKSLFATFSKTIANI